MQVCSVMAILGWAALALPGEFQLSPPAQAGEPERPAAPLTNLRELQDARGLALLIEDDASARQLEKLISTWSGRYADLLESDPELKANIQQTHRLFLDNIEASRSGVAPDQAVLLAIPKEKLLPWMKRYLQSLLHRRGLDFESDLNRLGASELDDICVQSRAIDSRQGLSRWRSSYLMWRYRDSEVRRLLNARDDRTAFLTPVRLEEGRDTPVRQVLGRYLAMLRNLRLQVMHNRDNPYEMHRTLDGLLRGLRYMDTIREASATVGIDHLLMTRLFIQESEFIHHRVSLSGAYSIAQFLDIAVKDVWLFKHRIAGSSKLLAGIQGWEDLKSKIIVDPRMAIKASCLYVRRVRDNISRRLSESQKSHSGDLLTLLTLELFSTRRGMMRSALVDTFQSLAEFWPARSALPLPIVPIGSAVVPEPGAMLHGWMERTVRDLIQIEMSEKVFQGRLERLEEALTMAAYNAGTSNLRKVAKRKDLFGGISFPLQLTENRDYVDSILDGVDVLGQVDYLTSDVARMNYQELIELSERACRKAGRTKSAQK